LSDKWFSNHGHAVGTFFAIASFFVALLANWKAIQEHQNLIAWWPVIVIPATVYLAFRIGRSTRSVETIPTSLAPAPAEPMPEKTPSLLPKILTETENRFWHTDDEVIIQRKTVKLGDYWELREGIARLKITPLEFKDVEKRPPYVELRMDTGGSMYYGGDLAIECGVNRIALAQTSSGFQAEEHCAYQYSFSDEHVHFAAIRVDHINRVGNEVVLEVCLVSLHKTRKLGIAPS
jgi:hypothetical protein